jgi:hypothetical protein
MRDGGTEPQLAFDHVDPAQLRHVGERQHRRRAQKSLIHKNPQERPAGDHRRPLAALGAQREGVS